MEDPNRKIFNSLTLLLSQAVSRRGLLECTFTLHSNYQHLQVGKLSRPKHLLYAPRRTSIMSLELLNVFLPFNEQEVTNLSACQDSLNALKTHISQADLCSNQCPDGKEASRKALGAYQTSYKNTKSGQIL